MKYYIINKQWSYIQYCYWYYYYYNHYYYAYIPARLLYLTFLSLSYLILVVQLIYLFYPFIYFCSFIPFLFLCCIYFLNIFIYFIFYIVCKGVRNSWTCVLTVLFCGEVNFPKGINSVISLSVKHETRTETQNPNPNVPNKTKTKKKPTDYFNCVVAVNKICLTDCLNEYFLFTFSFLLVMLIIWTLFLVCSSWRPHKADELIKPRDWKKKRKN